MKLFDLDGTLIDSNGIWIQTDLDFLAKRGLVPTPEYTEFVSHSIFPIAAQFTKDYYHLSDSMEEITVEWMSAARDAYAHHAPLKPGVVAYLAHCRALGEPMALVTASVPELCHLALDRHGLTSFFSQIIFAQALDMEKRDPRFFASVAEQLGVSLRHCVLYDDAPAVCASAKAAGMTVVGVYDRAFAASEEYLRGLCDHYILDFTALLD